jgi:hypothetical protein
MAGQNPIYTVYIRFFGRETTKYTVIYGVFIRFWPTLAMTIIVRCITVVWQGNH